MHSKRISIHKTEDKIEYSYDRYTHFSFLFIFFLLSALVKFFLDFKLEDLNGELSDIFFKFLFLVIALYFLYSYIDSSFNTTVVSITKDLIYVKESPVPTRIPVKIKRSEVRRTFIISEKGENDGTKYEYNHINIVLVDNTEYPLFRHINNLSDAKELEALLRQELFRYSD